MPAGWGEARHGVGGDLTFFKNLQSNSLPTGKSFQSNATKFPHPRLHFAVNPKAEPKKGAIKISPNKTLQSYMFPLQLQLYVLTIIRVTLRRIHKPLGESPHFVNLNIPFLVKGTKKVSFISLL